MKIKGCNDVDIIKIAFVGIVLSCLTLGCFPGGANDGGYLNSGPTVKVGSEVLEPDSTSLELADKIKISLDEERKKRKSLESSLANVRSEKEDLEAKLAEAERRLELANKRLEKALSENDDLTKQLYGTRKKLAEAEANLDEARAGLLKAQLAEVKAQQELTILKIEQVKNISAQTGG